MKSFATLFEEAKRSDAYWIEGAIQEFTESLCFEMKKQGVTRAELARRLGSSPAYVTKILRGEANFTLATQVRLGRALEKELRFHFATPGQQVHWMEQRLLSINPEVGTTLSANNITPFRLPAGMPASLFRPGEKTGVDEKVPFAA
jgi:transcriptional regulator with XRE-family HTH domain